MGEQGKRWHILPRIPPDAEMRLRAYHPVMAQVLYNRGQDTEEKARRFLHGGESSLHNPFIMFGMKKAVGRIRSAIRQDELIAVYGDFDADGVTSTALLTLTLQALGARVRPFIPHRVDDGYGLNNDSLKMLADEGVRLVITVDCGIRSIEEVAYASHTLGLDMIVTDHHSIGEELPPALAVVNPKIDASKRLVEGLSDGYPEDMLAGVGVAFKLADALLQAESRQPRRGTPVELKAEDLLDLVALGTVADLMPMDRAENRELVRRGLDVLNNAKRPGVYELMAVARVDPGKVTAMSIGFMLGPRINAAGRLDSAMIACELLMTPDIAEAGQLALRLNELNVERQTLTQEAMEIARARALGEAGHDVPLLFDVGSEFTPGIVGLVAGRLCEEFYRPAIVVGAEGDEWRGSCRSIPEFNITQALDQCADLLVRHGGHAQAAGFTVSKKNLPILRQRLTELAAQALAGRDLRPALEIDAEVPYDHLTMELAQALQALEPTGVNNATPLLLTRRLRVLDYRRVGNEGKHLRLRLSNGYNQPVDAIAFRQGEWASGIPAYVDAIYHLEVNEWGGQRKLQLNVQDLQASGTVED